MYIHFQEDHQKKAVLGIFGEEREVRPVLTAFIFVCVISFSLLLLFFAFSLFAAIILDQTFCELLSLSDLML